MKYLPGLFVLIIVAIAGLWVYPMTQSGHRVNNIAHKKFFTGERGKETYLYPTVRVCLATGGNGSGVIIWNRGPWIKVLTAGHVVAEEIEGVTIRNQYGNTHHTKFKVVKANDMRTSPDLGLIRVWVGDVPVRVAPIAGNATPVFMEQVVTVGCPVGRSQQAEVGILNVDMHQKLFGARRKFTRVSTPVINGNSGGPVMLPSGHVIAITSGVQSMQGHPFAPPIPITHLNFMVSLDQIHEFLEGVNLK
jgi:S1-C subfamily serine protease